jgi:hypothetical protein
MADLGMARVHWKDNGLQNQPAKHLSSISSQLIYAVAADDIRRHNSKEMPPVQT